MTVVDIPKHPAKFTASIIDVIRGIVLAEQWQLNHPIDVLDPMAGVGGIHAIANSWINTVGVELEPEWVNPDSRTIVGDATNLDQSWTDRFDVVATSPPYANRMADAYDGRDGSKRMTYRIQLGRPLTDGSGAGMQWGIDYRAFGVKVISEMIRVARPGGLIIVNISNHIRKGAEIPVAEWWRDSMTSAGLILEQDIPVQTPRMGFGANAKARVDCEWVYVTRKPS